MAQVLGLGLGPAQVRELAQVPVLERVLELELALVPEQALERVLPAILPSPLRWR